jgi:hypothetical protein
MNNEHKIRAWLMRFPGLVKSDSPQHVLMEALNLFKSQTLTECDLAVFTDALWRAGYRPEQVGPRWQLALPVKPLSDDSHYRRLRNITG